MRAMNEELTSVELCLGSKERKLPRHRDAGAGWRTDLLTSSLRIGGTKAKLLF